MRSEWLSCGDWIAVKAVFVAPLGGVSHPLTVYGSPCLYTSDTACFELKSLPLLTLQYIHTTHVSLYKIIWLLLKVSSSCPPPSESGMWKGFWERPRRCSLIHLLCTVLSTTPQHRTWWWLGATTLWYECGGLILMTLMVSCSRSLRFTTVSSTQFVLTLKVWCSRCCARMYISSVVEHYC